jgi:hypothetical protein
MRLFKYSFILAAAAALLPLIGCEDESISESKAILVGESEINLPAIATSRTMTVYADGTWQADVTDTWLSVSPTSGQGTMDITVTAEENFAEEAREASLIIKGASTLEDVIVPVTQKMDRFRDVTAQTVTEALSLKAEDRAKLSECQIVAQSKNGFVVSDGTSDIYVVGSDNTLSLGCRLTLTGDVAQLNGINVINLEDAFFVSEGTVEYPAAAKDLTAETAYAPGKVEYVSISAVYATGDKLSIDGKQVATLYEPTEDYSAIVDHNTAFTGYYLGEDKKGHLILAVSYEDLGKAEIRGQELPFKDDFSWLAPFIEEANAKLPAKNKITDCVSLVTAATDGCANIYSTLVSNGILVLDELRSRGYTDLNPSSKTIYLQDQYFKFGATGKVSGLTLPNFKIEGSMDLFLTFKWCSHMPKSTTPDATQLVVEIAEGPGAIVTSAGQAQMSDLINHNQKQGEMFWNDAMVKIVGATAETRLSIHPYGEVTSSTIFRYYLDDIQVVSAEGMVEANVEVGGIENDLVTFDGTPAAPVTFTVKSDADFTISTTASWLHLDVAEGLAGEESTVTLTCDQSELSTLRQGEIVIKSGLTTRKIQVVQSAAGQTLSPFISIVGGNYVNVNGTVTSATVSVQANVSYEVEVTEGSDWLSAEAVGTKAMVDVTTVALTLAENSGSASRTGKVRVYNTAEKVEALITVTQTPAVITLAKWVLNAETMASYADKFGGTAGTKDKAAGDGGMYVPANGGGSGKLSYVQVDKTDIDKNSAASRIVGSTGEPYITGGWPGDYWLFTVDYPEGIPVGAKIHGYFVTRASAGGMKYFLAEILDGDKWKPVTATTTSKVNDEDVTYNISQNKTADFTVDFNYVATKASKGFQIRVKVVANFRAGGSGALEVPNGGTHRIRGGESSPYFEMTM